MPCRSGVGRKDRVRRLLTRFSSFIFFLPPKAEWLGASGAGSVSGALVSMLLSGGCGHENLRLLPPLSLDRWLRPPVRLARPVGANGFAAELAAVQHRADRRGRLSDHNGPGGLLPERG